MVGDGRPNRTVALAEGERRSATRRALRASLGRDIPLARRRRAAAKALTLAELHAAALQRRLNNTALTLTDQLASLPKPRPKG